MYEKERERREREREIRRERERKKDRQTGRTVMQLYGEISQVKAQINKTIN